LRWFIFLFPIFISCSLSGVIVDRTQTEASLDRIHLTEYPSLKVYHGGAVREVPLKDIQSVKIYAEKSIVYNEELYFAAEMTLQDGSQIGSSANGATNDSQCYLSVHNTIKGMKRGALYRISIENVSEIRIE